MPKRQAIIFDMDGLMVDSEPLARRAWNEVLKRHGHQITGDIYRQMIGRRTKQAGQILLDNYPLPMTCDELVAEKTAVFHQIRAQGVPAMPGLMTLQVVIKKQRIPWAVATSSPREHANIILAQLGLTDECHAIAAGDEVTHGKPAPDIYLLAAARLDIRPDLCLALEDSEPGCQAAQAAGMKVIAIPNGETTTGSFACAKHRFASLEQVAYQLNTLMEN